MRITKYEQSCLVVDKSGSRLVIDPGSFLTPPEFDNVVAVVITHQHADHWTPDNLARIVDQSPAARIFGPQGVADAAEGYEVEVVQEGDRIEVAPFTLAFYGSKHAVIHSSIPVVDNVGVLVDDELFYGGDALDVPPVPVGTLAAPISAPWLKIGEAMDYVLQVRPERAFYVHDITLSVAGLDMTTVRLRAATEAGGGEYFELKPGESLDL